jgi:SOS-response transcriptional repressor LexA
MLLMAQADPRARIIESSLRRLGLSYNWLAKKLGTSHVNIGNWLVNEVRPRDTEVWRQMIEVIQAYEASRGGATDLTLKRQGLRFIPLYPGLSAGTPEGVDSHVDMIEVMDWGTSRERWARVIDGYSMEPELVPGDIAIFEDRPWEQYHVVHVEGENGDCVKIVKGYGDGVKLVPANPEYAPVDAGGMTVKGVLVGFIRQMANGKTVTTDFKFGMRVVPPEPI